MSARRLLAALGLVLGLGLPLAAGATDTTPLFAATLTGTDGQPVDLGKFRGKPLIVNFWARWCPPCRKEIPELVKLQGEFGGRGLVVLGIAVEDDPAAVKEFANAYDVNYPVVVDKKKALWLMQTLGNASTGLPFTLLIDRSGAIVQRKMGQFTRQDFDAAAPALLK
ncbi:TlpA family protein disulfide reductase [Azonexus fungiphilus]|uniref:TlpA family protein disulfide reductase n=1 Tax=Azonexus fungiphilus TaxID=146940 RepID=UPI003463D63E